MDFIQDIFTTLLSDAIWTIVLIVVALLKIH
jgi:hypothetical protein